MKRFVAATLIASTLACGSNTGTLVSTSPAAPAVIPTPQSYNVGDVIEVGDQTITLNSATVQGSNLVTNFTVTNNGADDLSISQYVNFSAKDTDGVKLEIDLFDCGPSVDGTIIPGDKVKGDICWKMTGGSSIRIYYEANIFEQGAIVWDITP